MKQSVKKVLLKNHPCTNALFDIFKTIFIKQPSKECFEIPQDCLKKLGFLNTDEILGLPPYPIPDEEDGFVEDIIGVDIKNIGSFKIFKKGEKKYIFNGTIWFQRFEKQLHLIPRQGNLKIDSID